MSAVTELQSLEREIAILRKVLKTCTSPNTETTSVAALRIYNAITTQQPSVHNNNKMILDHFAPLPIPKGTTTASSTNNANSSNPQRTTYSPDESGDGCCVVC
jgi:hypothetical protein